MSNSSVYKPVSSMLCTFCCGNIVANNSGLLTFAVNVAGAFTSPYMIQHHFGRCLYQAWSIDHHAASTGVLCGVAALSVTCSVSLTLFITLAGHVRIHW